MRRAQPDYVALTAAAVLLGVAAEAVRKQPHLPPSVRWTLGWVPSFAFALGIVSFGLLIGQSRQVPPARRRRTGISLLIGALAYEVEQHWSRRRTFDWWDLVALVAGAAVALTIDWYYSDRNVSDDHQPVLP